MARALIRLACLALLLFVSPTRFACAAAGADPALHVFIVGDSTASWYGPSRYPRMGWGQVIDRYVDAGVTVHDHAQSGRSARSFIQQGWLYGVARALRAGDLLLIQFGHNDEKFDDDARYDEPMVEFPTWLRQYIVFARSVGARPVLLTPVARRHFVDGAPIDLHGAWGEAVRALAVREHVPLIDLGRDSLAWLDGLGEHASLDYYLHVPAQQLTDNTHFQERGALAVACLVLRRLARIDARIDAHAHPPDGCAIPPPAPRAPGDTPPKAPPDDVAPTTRVGSG